MHDFVQEADALRVSVEGEFDVNCNRIVGIKVTEFTLSAFEDEDIPTMIGVGLLEVLRVLCAQSKDPVIHDSQGFTDCEDWMAQFVHPSVVQEALGKAKEEMGDYQESKSLDVANKSYPEDDWALSERIWEKRLENFSVRQLQVLANVMEWTYRQGVRLQIAFMPPWSDLLQSCVRIRDFQPKKTTPPI